MISRFEFKKHKKIKGRKTHLKVYLKPHVNLLAV